MSPDDPRQRWIVVSDTARPASTDSAIHSFQWLDLLVAISEQRRLLFICAVCSFALASLFAYTRPNVYTATAQLLPPQQSQSAIASLFGRLGDVASLAGARDLLRNPGAVYGEMLKSRSVSDRLIDRFHLTQLYRVSLRSSAAVILASHTSVNVEKEGVIRLSVTDRDPKLAAQLANGYIEELSNLCDRIAVAGASQRRLFFDKQAAAAREHLAEAEHDLLLLQQSHHIIAPDQQIRVMIGSEADLRARIAAKTLQLQHLELSQTAESPEMRQTQHDLVAMQTQLREMTSGSASVPGETPVSEMPSTGLNYVRKLREVKYYEALMEALSKQLEAARLDEANEAVVIQTVDSAIVPDRRSGPHRLQYQLVGLLTGLFAPVIFISLRYLHSLRISGADDRHKWQMVRSALWIWKSTRRETRV